jgi:putative two-component system response regulator
MAIADVYDALRSPRTYKAAFAHDQSVRLITQGDERTKPSHFGPSVVAVFSKVAGEFDAIYERLKS